MGKRTREEGNWTETDPPSFGFEFRLRPSKEVGGILPTLQGMSYV